MSEDPPSYPGLDALLPAEMAGRAEAAGVRKASLDAISLFVLAILAGTFIALGGMFSTTVLAGGQAAPFGLVRLAAGAAFSLGLILVILGGAELFTGDTLMVMAWAAGKIRFVRMLRAWTIVYAGNLVGALGAAGLVFLSGQYLAGHGAVGRALLDLALAKATLPFGRALFLGVLCNVLVCLAVWLSLGARSAADKVLAVLFPVSAFVAAGFEHSVANMYLIPIGLLVKDGAPPELWAQMGVQPHAYAGLTWVSFVASLAPVTIGNLIGGAGMVGAVYWFIFLRPREPAPCGRS